MKTTNQRKGKVFWLTVTVGLGLIWATPSTPSTNEVASPLLAVMEQELYLDRVEQTGSPFDVAVLGPGFLVVETANGLRYSRGGSLKLTSSGTLVTDQGLPLLSVEGTPLTIERGPVQIDADGVVVDATGAIGQLKLVRIVPEQLEPDGNQLYQAPSERVRPIFPDEAWIYQGFLQNSAQYDLQYDSKYEPDWGHGE
ncbi:MAG: flagellar hook basal-body protein [Magnetococcales bacterium]|nr:flagellar hook basal-body protein [Magnetococcales bacterium]